VHSSLFSVGKKVIKDSGIQDHTFVVEHNCQDWDVVALRNPVNRSWHTEEVCAIANNLDDKLSFSAILEIGCELDSQSTASRPSESTTAAIDPRSWEGCLNLICDECRIRHCLNGPDGVLGT